MSTIAPSPSDAPSSFAVKLGYGAGNLGKSVVWTSFETFMLFYLVSIAGFPPLVAGMLLTATMLWDGVADAGIAWWTDRHGRAQALGRLVLFGAPMGGIGFWLAFTLEQPAAIALTIVLCRFGYSMCDIGHNTLLVRVARTARDASTASGVRLIFSAIGAALVALASGYSLSLADRADQQAAFATGAAIGGTLYVATLFGAILATRRLPPIAGSIGAGRPPFAFHTLFGHRPFRRTLFLAAVQAGMVPLFLRALPFFGESVHGDASWAGPALATITLAQSLSLPVWIALARWQAPVRLALVAHAVMLVALGSLAIGSSGWHGSAALILAGIAHGGMNMALWALLALGIRSGASREAIPVGIFLAVLKTAAAASNAFLAALVAGASGPFLAAAALAVPLAGCGIAIGLLRGWERNPRD